MGQDPPPGPSAAPGSRRWRLLAAAGLVVIVAAPLAWLATRPAVGAGDAAAVEATLRAAVGATPATTVEPAPAASSLPPDVSPLPRFTVSKPAEPGPTPLPVGLRIDEIGIDAPVTPSGVDPATGEMEVPGNVRDVAWYEFGPRPGESGSAVLAAHVDLESQGAGVFFRLHELEPGDLVQVEFDNGGTRSFRVEARVRYDKSELPRDVIFASAGPPVLTLISCGGGFNPSLRRYDSNVVVYAYPLDGPIR